MALVAKIGRSPGPLHLGEGLPDALAVERILAITLGAAAFRIESAMARPPLPPWARAEPYPMIPSSVAISTREISCWPPQRAPCNGGIGWGKMVTRTSVMCMWLLLHRGVNRWAYAQEEERRLSS